MTRRIEEADPSLRSGLQQAIWRTRRVHRKPGALPRRHCPRVQVVVAPNRMPVILKAQDYAPWLNPKNAKVDELARLLVPYPADELKAHPVSTLVNNPRIDDPRCIKSVTAP